MNHRLAFAAFFTLLPLSVFAGCSDDETGDNGPSGPGSGAASSSGPSSSSGASGASGGSGAEGGAGATGGTGGTGTTGGTGGTGGGTGGGTSEAADHLVISEVIIKPTTAEFIEIHNPGNAAVDLSDYWVSDNSLYYTVTEGGAWDPDTNNPGSDFAAKFPDGASIPGGGYITIATKADFAGCATYTLAGADVNCDPGTSVAMELVELADGDPDATTVSDAREMVVLFQWDGATDTVKDVDYVLWGVSEAGTFIDKSGVTGYAADTAQAMQKAVADPDPAQGFQRCPDGNESSEGQSGGNGITGNDETSEDLTSAFKPVTGAGTPAAANACN